MSENECLARLAAARIQVARLRRFLVEQLGVPFKAALTEPRLTEQRMEQLVAVQRAIKALDEAIDFERAIAGQTGRLGPPVPLGLQVPHSDVTSADH